MKYPEISRRMSYILNIRQMKAGELAEKAEINKASISQYVNGSHCPSNITAQAMADVLNVDPLWLMGFDVEMNRESATEREKHFADVYSRLNEYQQRIVNNLMESLLNEEE